MNMLTLKLRDGTTETLEVEKRQFLAFETVFKVRGDGERIVEGYGSTFRNTDRTGDVIDPGAFGASLERFKQMPNFFWMHQWDTPVGVIEEIREDEKGLFFRAKLLANDPNADYVWNLLRQGAVRATSIGFMPLNGFIDDFGVRHLTDIELYEISLVTVPANPEALLTSIKTLGQEQADAIRASILFAASVPALRREEPEEKGAATEGRERTERLEGTMDEMYGQALEDFECASDSASKLLADPEALKKFLGERRKSAKEQGVVDDLWSLLRELRAALNPKASAPGGDESEATEVAGEAPPDTAKGGAPGDTKAAEETAPVVRAVSTEEGEDLLTEIIKELRAEKPELFV